jgi:hypothetical protein
MLRSKEKSQPLSEIEFRFLGSPASKQITIPAHEILELLNKTKNNYSYITL